jgi:DNA-binding SARP family transcriptional activator
VTERHVRVGVLGRTVLTSGTASTPLSPTQRCLLAALVLAGDDGASPERLVEVVWGDDPPATARPSLHNQLARLRRHLPPDTVTWDGRRYRLDGSRVDIDVTAFARTCAAAGVAAERGDAATLFRRADDALRLWRGEPFADVLTDGWDLDLERVRLDELRDEVEDARARALLDTGRLPAAIATLQELVRTAPQREGRWTTLIVALTRAGRRADALATYEDARRYFAEELEIPPPRDLAAARRHIDRHTARAPEVDGASGPVLGRAALVGTIGDQLEHHQVLLLTGEAGVGKSSVVDELVARRHREGRRTVAVTCATNPWSALQPIVDLLEHLRPELEALRPAAGATTWQLLGGGPVDASRSALGNDPGVLQDEVADTLGRVADELGDLTIVLDDAHRGGPTTHRLLRATLTRCPGIRLVAVARHPTELPPDLQEAAHVVVPPLDREAIGALVVRHTAGGADADDLVTWLTELTGGNALFVTGLLTDLERRGVLSPDEGGRIRPPDTVEVPRRLHEAIGALIGSLGLATRRALDVAAVLDEPVEDRSLAELVDPADLVPAIEAGIVRRTSPTTVTFGHELLRRVAYDLIPAGRRLELHHAAANIGRGRAVAAPQVAEHALAAATLDPNGAVYAARDAGEAAVEALAFEEAAVWFDRAAEVAAVASLDDLERLRLEVEAADAQRCAGLAGHAERLLDAAERAVRSGDAELRQRAVLAALRLGETGEPGPLQRRAADLANDALRVEEDPDAVAAIRASASLVHSLSGEPERCRELFTDALALLADDDPVTAVQVLPYAYMGLAHADDLPLREAAAVRLQRDAALLDDPVGAYEGGHLAFSVALQRGDGTAARAAHERMRRLLDRVGDAGRRWSFCYQQAAIDHLDGDLDRAEASAEEALRIGSGVAASRAFGAYAGQLVELRRQAGRLDELVPLVAKLIDEQDTLPAWRAIAAQVLAEDDPDRSEALFDELAADDFAALPRDFSWLGSLVALTRSATVRGDAARAARSTRRLAAYVDRGTWQGTCCYGPVATATAEAAILAGDRVRAATCASTAVEVARRLTAPRYLAEAEAVLART